MSERESFEEGQRVIFRADWLDMHLKRATYDQKQSIAKWTKMPHMTVLRVENRSGTTVTLDLADYTGTWTCEAITALPPKEILDDDLFTI